MDRRSNLYTIVGKGEELKFQPKTMLMKAPKDFVTDNQVLHELDAGNRIIYSNIIVNKLYRECELVL